MSNLTNGFAVLTADARYDERLTARDKILYSEIIYLSNGVGYCTETKEYFAEVFNISNATVLRRIKNLKKCGYLTEVKTINEERNIEKRLYPKFFF